MSKRIFIIHGWGGYPDEGWQSWLKEELSEKGFSVQNPKMPETDEPKIGPWVEKLANEVVEPDENTFFVGHSIGCQTILRYLEKLPESIKIGGVVLVAPWTTLKNLSEDEEKIASPWIQTPIDWNKVKNHTDKFISIFSDNDSVVDSENSKVFKINLGAETIVEKNKGHFSGEDNVNELPSALDSVLKIAE